MKTYLRLSALVFLLIGCTMFQFVGAQNKNSESKIEVIENGAWCDVKYKSYNMLIGELKKKSENELWTNKLFKEEKQYLPLGGQIRVTVKAYTVDAASGKYWEFVVQTLEGKEVLRKQGIESLPEYTLMEYGAVWWDINLIDLRKKILTPFKLFVIDKLMTRRSAYIIYPNGTE